MKAVIETEVFVPVWSETILVQDKDARVWLAQWLAEHFDGEIVGDRITYGKMRITFEAIDDKA